MGAGRTVLQPGDIFADDFRVVRSADTRRAEASYVVDQLSSGKQRVLRLLLPELVADEGRRASFEQEARIGSRIESEHVIDVVGAGIDTATGTPWLVTELLRGEDVASLVKREGAVPRPIALEILEQLGDAIGAAHAAGMVHGHLAPEDVLLAEPAVATTKYRVKVLDLGIAELLTESRPEQASGGGVGPEADVRSIGLIASHLLTGRPFGSEPEESTTVPPGFDAWLARSLDRDAGAGFEDVRAQLQALRPVLAAAAVAQAEPVAAAPAEPVATAPAEPAPPAPAEPVAAAPAEPVAAAPAEPVAPSPAEPPTKRTEPTPAAPSSGPTTRALLLGAVALAALLVFTSPFILRKPKVATPASTEAPASTEGTALASAAIPAVEPTPVASASDADASAPVPQVDASADDAASGTAASVPGFGHGGMGGGLNIVECTAGPRLTEDDVRSIVVRNSGALKQSCWDKSPVPILSISETVHVVICGTGAVQSVSASSNDSIGKCIENVVKGWRFPAGGAIDIPYRFTRDSVPTGPAGPGPFDRGAAYGALGSVDVQSCKKGETGPGHVKITFAPSGLVTNAVVDAPPFAGTSVGNCVAAKFRGAHIPPFLGPPITLGKSFTIN